MKSILPSLLALAGLASLTSAATVGLTAIDSGFINEAGRSSKNDGVLLGAPPATFNYSTGTIAEIFPLSGSDVNRRNFFTFDLTGIAPGTITGASLELYLPTGGFTSPDATEEYVLMGIPATPPPSGDMALFATDLTGLYDIGDPGALGVATALYGALGSGPGGFGAITVSDADEDSTLTIPLTPAAVGYLNTFAGGPTVLAGEVSTLDLFDGIDEVVFGFTGPLIPGVVTPDPVIPVPTPTPVLTLEIVPEPSTGLLGLVAGLLLLHRFRQRPRR